MKDATGCAHCDDGSGRGNDSMDNGKRVRCPACTLLVCPTCRAKSNATTCGHCADDAPEPEELETHGTP